nr:ribosomal protein L2 [Coccidia sp. AB-2023a]
MKKYLPITPGLRYRKLSLFPKANIKVPKNLRLNWKRSFGRNVTGNITSFHRGGGHKKQYINIDFGYANHGKDAESAIILDIKYDSFRTSFIGLILYLNGKLKGTKRYILLTHNMDIGNIIFFGKNSPIQKGNSLPLSYIPLGSYIYNIELNKNKGAALVRSAGSKAQLLSIDDKYATIKLPSGEIRLISKNSYCILGNPSHSTNALQNLGKAGSNRHKSIRPTVRGGAMNPCDHPHGGGEGRNPIGRKLPYTHFGKPGRGIKTRSNKKLSNRYILQVKS